MSRVIEPSDDWRMRGLDEWLGEVRRMTPEELRQQEEAREDRAD